VIDFKGHVLGRWKGARRTKAATRKRKAAALLPHPEFFRKRIVFLKED
jgi:hypothetical protein